ncbi:hypothetical protein ACFPRL_28360 [Pseudoclavibacter helvolus]
MRRSASADRPADAGAAQGSDRFQRCFRLCPGRGARCELRSPHSCNESQTHETKSYPSSR